VLFWVAVPVQASKMCLLQLFTVEVAHVEEKVRTEQDLCHQLRGQALTID
jgi:hypothetical protein